MRERGGARGGLEMVVWVIVMYLMAHAGTRVCLGCVPVRGLVFFLALRLVSRGSVCVYPACCNATRPCLSQSDGFPLPGGRLCGLATFLPEQET